MLDSVALQLVRISGTENLVACDLGADYLADDITVCEADNKTVFGSIVFVLGLGDEAFASIVIGLTSTTALVLGLIPAAEVLALLATINQGNGRKYSPVVRTVLDQLGERLLRTLIQQFALQSHPKHLA